MAATYGTQPKQPWEMDPWAQANQRAQARVDAGTSALQQQLANRVQGYQEARNRLKDDAEWALRTGADANMRRLQGQGAINSGLRDRYAQRLQAQVGRPLMRGMENLGAQQTQAEGDIQSQIAALRGSLPVLQAEELGRQYNLDAQALAQAMQEASMTGRYMPAQAKALIQGVMQRKQGWKAAAAQGDMETANQLHAEANQMRDALQAMGIDPATIGADVTLEGASAAAPNMGTLTPAQRQMLVGMTGVDPVTGQMTLAGQQSQQALQQGQINLDIMKNPEYGAAAQAQAQMQQIQAQIRSAMANAAAAERAGAASAQTATSRADITKKWGLTDTGLTTNFQAMDMLLTELAQEAMDGNLTPDKLEAFLYQNSRQMRANGIDPTAVQSAAQAFNMQAARPVGLGASAGTGGGSPAWQALRTFESGYQAPPSAYTAPALSQPSGPAQEPQMPMRTPPANPRPTGMPVIDPRTGAVTYIFPAQ